MLTDDCKRNCWIAGACTGLFVWIMTAAVGDLGWFSGLLLGLITTGLLGAFLVWFACEGHVEAWEDAGTSRVPVPVGTKLAGSVEAPPAAAPAIKPAVQKTQPVSEPAAEKPEPAPKVMTQAPQPKAASDDLKEIKGIGPKLEQILHENGVTTFQQMADWTEADKDRFAELIGSLGSRIRSEDWPGQARLLAAGGDTEHFRKVAKSEA